MPCSFTKSFKRLMNCVFLSVNVDAGMLCNAGLITKHNHIVRRSPPVDRPFAKPTSSKAWQHTECLAMLHFRNCASTFDTGYMPLLKSQPRCEVALDLPLAAALSSFWRRACVSKRSGQERHLQRPIASNMPQTGQKLIHSQVALSRICTSPHGKLDTDVRDEARQAWAANKLARTTQTALRPAQWQWFENAN